MADLPALPDPSETRDPRQREQALMAQLPTLIARAKAAPGWNRILQGVNAAEIDNRNALAQLPVTRKSDLGELQKARSPFGGLNVTPHRELRRLFVSPGPIFDPEGRGDDWWRFLAPMQALGLRAGHIVLNCFSYHFTPAAFMVEGAAHKLGCAVIPAGVGQTELQVQAIAALRPDAYVGTPSFLKLIIEKAAQLGADMSSLQMALVSGEALPPSLRQWLVDHGVPRVLQLYASADVGNIAFETMSGGTINPGLVLDEQIILEIVRPGTGQPVAPGEVGEVVITSFNADYPLIRFGTGDLSAVLDGLSPCGRTNTRIKGWMGRADQTTKVRGMFVHPAQVADVLRRHPQVGRARLVVSGKVSDELMTLHCECAAHGEPGGLPDAIAGSIRELTKLRGDVRLVAPGSLPNDGKVIDDARSYD